MKSKFVVGFRYQICNSCLEVTKKKYFIGSKGQETKTCNDCRYYNKIADDNRIGRLDKKYNIATKIGYYLKKCKDNKIPLELSEDDIKSFLIKGECYYCAKTYNGQFPLGIDRINPDRKIGYTKENCVTCCDICNYMKGILPYNTFIEMCRIITVNLGIFHMNVFRYIIPNKWGVYFTHAIIDTNKKKVEREIEFLLDREDFYLIKSYVCYLCGKDNTKYHKNGIDRVNNKESYIITNCKSCCGTCNFIITCCIWNINYCDPLSKVIFFYILLLL